MKTAKKNYNAYVKEIVLSYKTLNTEKIKVSNPNDVFEFVRDKIGYSPQEHFGILCVNNKNIIYGWKVISIGTITESIVHPREVFVSAIEALSSGVIITHNHPSGILEPSRQDVTTTQRLIEAGKIIGIPILDHMIVSDEGYFSFKEHNYM